MELTCTAGAGSCRWCAGGCWPSASAAVGLEALAPMALGLPGRLAPSSLLSATPSARATWGPARIAYSRRLFPQNVTGRQL